MRSFFATQSRQLTLLPLCLFLLGAFFYVGVVQPAAAQIQDEQIISADEGTPNSFTLKEGNQFGNAATHILRLDGDPNEDVAVGAFKTDDGGPNRGAVWILDLDSDGTAASAQKISSTAGDFNGGLDNKDRFGKSVAALGDLDGNGKPSIAVGAPAGLDNTDPGSVWVLELDTDGTVANQQIITQGTSGFGGSLANTDKFGSGVADLGDIDGDDKTNIAVGAFGTGGAQTPEGAVWILDLNNDGTVADEQKISSSSGNFEGSLGATDKLGNSVSNLGDLNDDDNPELAATAPGTNGGTGAIWILSLNGDGTVASEQKISTEDGGFSGDQLGGPVAATQDLNSDDNRELLNGVPDANKTWILYLDSDRTVKNEEAIAEGSGGFDGTLSNGDSFGSAVTPIGNLDSDNTLDLLIGANSTDDGGTDYGAAWTLFGGSYPLPVELVQFDAQLGEGAVELSWQTASETNNSGFTVQRRTGASWTSLGFVESHVDGGTTSQPQSYQFRDAALPHEAEQVEYRLKQVDLDGTTSLSDPTVVERPNAEGLILEAPRPNPADQTATVHVELPDEASAAELTLYDLLGQEVRRIPLSGTARQTKTLNTAPLGSGTYILRLSAEGTSAQTERLTVVH